jgi:hypothetical protein
MYRPAAAELAVVHTGDDTEGVTMNKTVNFLGAVGSSAVVLLGLPNTASAALDHSAQTAGIVAESNPSRTPAASGQSAGDTIPLAASRSVDVTLVNRSSCDLVLTGTSIPHGIWITTPPSTLEAGFQVTWRTESSGILTGTEGSASWLTANCDSRANKNKNVWLHWSSPWSGSANYSGGAGAPFSLTWNGTPDSNATVTAFFQGA